MSGSPSCQTYSSSTVISYSSTDSGAPKVYQQTSELRTAPGGVRGRAGGGARRGEGERALPRSLGTSDMMNGTAERFLKGLFSDCDSALFWSAISRITDGNWNEVFASTR